MKRSKKLVINLALIFVLLLGLYYFGGFYVSKQQCVLETLRGLYGMETREVMELRQGNYIATLMADEEGSTFSIVGTKKIGPLYRTASSSIGISTETEEVLKISGMSGSAYGFVVYLHRKDKAVAKVEVQLENGETFILEEWQDDFTGYMRENYEWENGIYRAYDADGELVGEVYY